MNGEHDKPSTSSGSEDTQESINGSSDTTQADDASGVRGAREDGNSANPCLPPKQNFTTVSRWLTSVEDNVLFYSSEFKSTVVQWLTDRLHSTDLQSTEAELKPPQCPTTRDDRPRAIYWWQKGANGSPAESSPSSSSSAEQQRPAKLYWWQRKKGLRSPTASEQSLSSDEKSDADVSMVAVLEECCNLDIFEKSNRLEHSEVPPEIEKKMWSSFESDVIDIPESLLLKCKPQPRRFSEISCITEEEVPVFFFVKQRPSSGRKSRSLERKCQSVEELYLSFDSLQSTELLSEQLQGPEQANTPSMQRVFVSEDNLRHRIASRGYRIYYTWLCVWYRIRREYKHVSAGIRKLNQENR